MLDAAAMIKLSYDMTPGAPVPEGIPEATVSAYKDISSDGGNVWLLGASSHTGTHIDAPNHMLEEGRDISGFSLEDFLFSAPCIVDVPLDDDGLVLGKDLKPFAKRIAMCDFLLIRTGWSRVRQTDGTRYASQSPGFSRDAARWVCGYPNIRAVGGDFLSFAAPGHVEEGVEAHKIMMRAMPWIQLYEDLYLPGEVADGELGQVLAVPWLFTGADSAPCTVYGIRNGRDASAGRESAK